MSIDRTFESFSWITIRRRTHPVMVGFGVSTHVFEKHPWSFEGTPLPYIGRKDHSSALLHWVSYTAGPFVVHFCRLRSLT